MGAAFGLFLTLAGTASVQAEQRAELLSDPVYVEDAVRPAFRELTPEVE